MSLSTIVTQAANGPAELKLESLVVKRNPDVMCFGMPQAADTKQIW